MATQWECAHNIRGHQMIHKNIRLKACHKSDNFRLMAAKAITYGNTYIMCKHYVIAYVINFLALFVWKRETLFNF